MSGLYRPPSHTECITDIMRSQFQGVRLHKMLAADVGLLAAMWWPFAPYEALKTSALLYCWVCMIFFM